MSIMNLKGSRSGSVAFLFGFLVLLLLGILAYEFFVFRPDKPSVESLRYTYDLAQSGDFAASEADARKKADVLSATSTKGQRAISGIATADFWSGDMQKRIEAVRITKEQLRTMPASPYNQALLVNRLLGYITTAMEPEIIDEIFKGEPFAVLRVEGDDLASLKSLAEYSLSKEYTNLANFKVGIWHASQIFKHHDGIQKLSEIELQERVTSIQKILEETDKHFDAEEKRMYGRPYWELQAPAFYYFQGFLYASIALVHREYLPKAEAAFQRVADYYQSRRTADGSPNAMIEARLVYTNFSLATFIHAIDGEKRLPEIRLRLQYMIDLMNAHPESHKGAFLAFMHQTMLDGPEKTQGRWYSYNRFLKMAELYAPFKDFLNSSGWDLR